MEKIWKVFIPHELLDRPSSFLHGEIDIKTCTIVITLSTTSSRTAEWLIQQGMSLTGTWNDSENDIMSLRRSKQSSWVSLSLDKENDLDCFLLINKSRIKCTAVIFDAKLLLKSILLQEKNRKGLEDNTCVIYKALESSKQSLSGFEVQEDLVMYAGQKETYMYSRQQRRIVKALPYLLVILYLPFWWIKDDERQGMQNVLQRVFNTPTTVKQLRFRVRDLKYVTLKTTHEAYNSLRVADSCLRQILDTLLGLLVMYILMKDGMADYVGNTVLTYGDVVAGELKTLLQWLKGAPAGLKLNSQLSHLLAQFFKYHIYLWTGYLYILKPVLGYMVYYSSVAGILGLTVQLSLYQDIFSTLTLHIYCFYVYAARLYCLQLYALASFWRLFRGKKWNVLRQRVDSAVYDVDQLFLGTLLFTVLLFLLPTTIIYYIVFTLLRLLVLMIQLVVGKVRQVLNTTPVWSILLWVTRSPKLTDGAVFHVINPKSCKKESSCLIVSMQMNSIDLQTVLKLTKDEPVTVKQKWSSFCKNLLSGELIFPWIEKKKNL